MEKILPFTAPVINHIPADASRLSILCANNEILPIVHNFSNIFAFDIRTNENKYVLDTQFFWNIPEIERKLVSKSLLDNIINFVWKALNDDYYVNICIDSCKLSSYKYYKVNEVFPHQMCIYGMNLSNEICYCADFFSKDGYQNALISINEIRDANDSLQKEALDLDPLTGATDWITDIELLKPLIHYNQSLNLELIYKNIQYFIDGKNMSGYSNYTRVRPHVMTSNNQKCNKWLYEAEVISECYGIRVFEHIQEFLLKSFECSDYNINYKMFYIMYAYQKLMHYRINYISKKIKDTRLVSIENKYKALLMDSQIILNVGLKLIIMDKESLKTQLLSMIKSHILNTKELLMEFLDTLSKNLSIK